MIYKTIHQWHKNNDLQNNPPVAQEQWSTKQSTSGTRTMIYKILHQWHKNNDIQNTPTVAQEQ
jgi:hypothetical protein